VQWKSDSISKKWLPTTLQQVGWSEEQFEAVLSDNPQLLGLESRRSGIRGPYASFRQLHLRTPQGRPVIPDIVFLTASGHVVIVEVKRHGNEELKDRRVIAQAIDYAASFSALNENQIIRLFNPGHSPNCSWPELIQELFPLEPEYDELAFELLSRFSSGNLNIVIACDKAPFGLNELVKGVAKQSSLEFDLNLVEVAPYVKENSPPTEIFFIPKTRLLTEIVARTAVTVKYLPSDTEPSVEIQMTDIEDIEENIRANEARQTRSGKIWNDEEIFEAFTNDENDAAKELFMFAKQNSAEGRITSTGKKIKPCFGFYVSGSSGRGAERALQIFRYDYGSINLHFYLNFARTLASEQIFQEFIDRLNNIFGNEIETTLKEPSIALSVVYGKIQEFKELMLWFKGAVR